MKNALDFIAHGNALHALSHYLSRVRSNIKAWKASGLNQIDWAILDTEQAIFALENSDNYLPLIILFLPIFMENWVLFNVRMLLNGLIGLTSFRFAMVIEIQVFFIIRLTSESINLLFPKFMIRMVCFVIIRLVFKEPF